MLINRSKQRGATLIETLISTLVFALLSVAIFVVYNVGSASWKLMYLRHNLQNEARRAAGVLERDLRRTDFASVYIYSFPTALPPGWTTSVPRWAICMVGLSDWSNPANFDLNNGKPIWNQYNIYMATTETNQAGGGPLNGTGTGRLLEITVPFAGAGTGVNALPLYCPFFVPLAQWANNVYDSDTRKVNHKMLASGFYLDAARKGELYDSVNVALTFSPADSVGPASLGTSDGNNPAQNVDDLGGNPNSSQVKTTFQHGVNNSNPPPVFQNYSVNVKVLSTAVFAFRLYRDDINRVVQVALKVRGQVNRDETGPTIESSQLDLVISPGGGSGELAATGGNGTGNNNPNNPGNNSNSNGPSGP